MKRYIIEMPDRFPPETFNHNSVMEKKILVLSFKRAKPVVEVKAEGRINCMGGDTVIVNIETKKVINRDAKLYAVREKDNGKN